MEFKKPIERSLASEEILRNRSAVIEIVDRYEELRQAFIASQMTSQDYQEARQCVDFIDMNDTLIESLDIDTREVNRDHAIMAYTEFTKQLLSRDPKLDDQIPPLERSFYEFIIYRVLENDGAHDKTWKDILSDKKLFDEIVDTIANVQEFDSLRDQLLHNNVAYQQYCELENTFIAHTNQAFSEAVGNNDVSNVYIDKPYIDISYKNSDPDYAVPSEDCIIYFDDENVFINKSQVHTKHHQKILDEQLQLLRASLQYLEEEH